jgi:putative flippase GtrA
VTVLNSTYLKYVLNSIIHPRYDNSIKAQAIRQFLSGCVATLCDFFIFWFYITIELDPLLAAICSASASLVVNFFITRYYVIGEIHKQTKTVGAQFLVYVGTALVSLAIFQILLLVFHYWLDFDPLYVKIASIPVVYIWTLLSSRFIVFNKNNNKFAN